MSSVAEEKGAPMSEEAIYTLHRYPSGELEEFEYVQELVRCKECKHYTETKGCLLEDNSTRQADDFCSYGERREP